MQIRLLALALAAAWGFAAPAAAQGRPVTDGLRDRFALSADASAPVLEFTERFGLVGNADPGPRVRVFADGRVEIHVPHYMKRAGDWELRLTRRELRTLLRQLIDRGVAEFDASRVRERLRAAREAERRAGALFEVHDASTTEIELRLERYQPRDRTKSEIRGLRRGIRWRALRSDARRHAGIREVADLAAAQEQLLALLDRPDLVRVGGSSP